MHIAYCPEASHESQILTLEKEESKHTVRVLKKKAGDKIWIVNGKGGWFESEIIYADNKKCDIQITTILESKLATSQNFHIAIAPTKSMTRFEWFLEKAAELGVKKITPILCDRSERKILNMERAEKKLIAALKQSQGMYLPEIDEPIKFKEFIQTEEKGEKYIATILDETKPLFELYNKNADCIVLIGPEGDFSDQEVELALENGYRTVSLGETRLRVETAAIIALHTLILKNQ